MPASDTDLTSNLIFLTNRVGRQLAALTTQDMEFEGWQPLGFHLGLVADLMQEDGVRQQDLATATIKDKGTVARALQTLEEKGIVRRETDASDRRQKLIYLTERGHRLWCHASTHAEETLALALDEVSPEDHRRCARVLTGIYHKLNQALRAPKALTNE